MPQSTLNMCSFLNNKKIDTSKLEFAGSRDIIKTFESMNMELSLASTSFSCINILSN
jgi:hypothetical protein